MKTLNILAVLVLLFFTAEAGSDCFSSLSSVTQALSVALTELEKTQAELKEVKAELEAEKNKSNSQTTVKPQTPKHHYLYQCTFENISACGYTQNSSNEATLIIGQGKVAKDTGPTADHTFGTPTGHYLYINGLDETRKLSNIFPFVKTARVKFPPIVPKNTSEICISFWYSMYGKDVKSLKFYLEGNRIGSLYKTFMVNGNKGPGWKLFQRELPKRKEKFSFSFEVTTEAYWEKDFIHDKLILHNVDCNIAIDDIQVKASSCIDTTLTTPSLTMVG